MVDQPTGGGLKEAATVQDEIISMSADQAALFSGIEERIKTIADCRTALHGLDEAVNAGKERLAEAKDAKISFLALAFGEQQPIIMATTGASLELAPTRDETKRRRATTPIRLPLQNRLLFIKGGFRGPGPYYADRFEIHTVFNGTAMHCAIDSAALVGLLGSGRFSYADATEIAAHLGPFGLPLEPLEPQS